MAQASLPGAPVEGGLLDLGLAFNLGVAFRRLTLVTGIIALLVTPWTLSSGPGLGGWWSTAAKPPRRW